MNLFKISSMSAVIALFRFRCYFTHQLSQLFFGRLLVNVYETIIIHGSNISINGCPFIVFATFGCKVTTFF